MPLREAFRIARGRNDRRRWPRIGRLFALAGGIIAALWLQAWVLFGVLGLRQVSLVDLVGLSLEQAARLARVASVATLASLGLVLVLLALLRLLVRRPVPSAMRCAAVTRIPAAAECQMPRARLWRASSSLRPVLGDAALNRKRPAQRGQAST